MRRALLSVTKDDCRWDYDRGTGAGGQKRNKTSSRVRCTHLPSGAVGISDDTRSQHQNKPIAFRRMAESATFTRWLRLECLRRSGELAVIEDRVEAAMRQPIRVEERIDGRWVQIAASSQDGADR
jgi:protein subunit release factor B